ncbi:MAG: nitronate monooxygenase [Bacillota bacterium]|nr:nitronate monooxygenase [Bacillota bacterium]
MKIENDLTELLNIKFPVIQAPMAGGITSSELVAEVSNAGGLGMIGAGYMSASQIQRQIQEVRHLTNHSFGINLFIPAKYSMKNIEKAKSILKPISEKLNIPDEYVDLPNEQRDLKSFHEQISVVIKERVPVCSFTFGLPPKEIVSLLKETSIVVIGTATSVEEAIMNEKAGMDAIVLQGIEAGGHRGTFLGQAHDSLIGLMALIPQVVDNVNIPVIAAGGIMDGRGLAAAKCLGAKAVQMGTAFVTSKESGANEIYKNAILSSIETDTLLTNTFTGKLARGIKNSFMKEMEQFRNEIPDYPIQNSLTKGIRRTSADQQNPEYMSLWSGQSPRLAKPLNVKELLERIMFEVEVIGKNF